MKHTHSRGVMAARPPRKISVGLPLACVMADISKRASSAIVRSGRRRRAICSSSGRRCGCIARNLIDSGSTNGRQAATSSGTRPPITNSTCQPYRGTSQAATGPGVPLPSVMPVNISTTSVARHRLGDSSELSAMVLGMSPPRPMPVITRSTSIWSRSCARAIASVLMP